jgi:farnesyl diphosphate synthase
MKKSSMPDKRNPHAMLLTDQAALVTSVLDDILRTQTHSQRLSQAMHYGVMSGGKRIRPVLLLETARLLGVDPDMALIPACALEALHCYSLIHDDLPAMDDDDMRRGQPTVHKAFDEASAVLAGDGLLTLAFDILSDNNWALNAEISVKIINILARASGRSGMIAGQMLDLDAEGRFEAIQKPKALSEQHIRTLQDLKTGRLFVAAIDMACVLGRAAPDLRKNLLSYGVSLGRAFQLADDLIDATSNKDEAGKATGKDAQAGKATLVSLYGIEQAQFRLDALIDEATRMLHPFKSQADWHIWLVQSMAGRRS